MNGVEALRMFLYFASPRKCCGCFQWKHRPGRGPSPVQKRNLVRASQSPLKAHIQAKTIIEHIRANADN